jgi:uncharacterized protein DUF6527
MPRARRAEGNRVHFWCPGCDEVHGIVHGDPATCWTWNGDLERPTFSPSILMKACYWEPPVTPENLADWKREPWEQYPVDRICHSFVTDGRIQFLGDCTHELAGQTVDLPEWPYGDGS